MRFRFLISDFFSDADGNEVDKLTEKLQRGLVVLINWFWVSLALYFYDKFQVVSQSTVTDAVDAGDRAEDEDEEDDEEGEDEYEKGGVIVDDVDVEDQDKEENRESSDEDKQKERKKESGYYWLQSGYYYVLAEDD
ncbi:hypothetical protein C5167_048795 [Papaver somniferum]|uniref:Uncharacterized protein n=1 Tax=Papaver somniferum TaxID=3469 RepID=A0A4Y7KMB7_PAPSO|nr:hypothetical protein C5167_048795 [Papaver somniferum]